MWLTCVAEIVRQAIADRDRARWLREARLRLEQGIEVGLRNFEFHIACGKFGVLVIDILTNGVLGWSSLVDANNCLRQFLRPEIVGDELRRRAGRERRHLELRRGR